MGKWGGEGAGDEGTEAMLGGAASAGSERRSTLRIKLLPTFCTLPAVDCSESLMSVSFQAFFIKRPFEKVMLPSGKNR
jgi:hypothetical protein